MPSKNPSELLEAIKAMGDPANLSGMARFGIKVDAAVGASMPGLRKLAKETGRDHQLALAMWETGVHEARIFAALIDVPKQVTEAQMDAWVSAFNSWDLCDQCCMNLFDRTPYAYDKAIQWAKDDREFVKRAGFAIMASLAIHDKKAPDEKLLMFMPVIMEGATDERNFVKKAVNWALRQIGKRSIMLNKEAIALSERMLALNSKSAKWIATDALKELKSPEKQARLNAKGK